MSDSPKVDRLVDALRDLIADLVREELQRQSQAETRAVAYVSVEEAATITSLSTRTIRDRIRDGRLPIQRLGRAIRIRRDDVTRVFDAQSSKRDANSYTENARRLLGVPRR